MLVDGTWTRTSLSRRRILRPLRLPISPPARWPEIIRAAQKKTGDSIARISRESGAGNEARTRDLNLGKVALYQLSYSR